MQSARWTWDPKKASANLAKHGVSFEIAQMVFFDPLHISLIDPHESDERWRTLGRVGPVVLFVVHTIPIWESSLQEEVGRIISARKATRREREAYEDG